MTWTPTSVIGDLRDLDETSRIEAKRGFGKSARSSISAFANEPDLGGGWLVFGVARDDDGHYSVVGVPDPDQLQAELSTECRTRYNRVLRPDVRVERVEGQVVVVAYIPETVPADKPVYLSATGLPSGGYRRIGSTDQRLVDSDLTELASLAQFTPFDRRPLAQARRSDLDDDAIAAFRTYLHDARPSSELLSLGTNVMLEAIGALVPHHGILVPSAAGILLLGSKLALRRLFPTMRVDYIRIRGTSWSGEALDNYTAIEIREALILGWRRVFAAVMDDLPKSFHLPLGEMQRRDQPAVPERVIREAVINALSHRSYEVHSAIQIRRYSDRIEIDNPGYSLVPEEQWGRPVSKTRNPTLTSIFRDLDLAETRGTGIRRMRERMAEASLAPPHFESDREAGRFMTTFHLHHFLSGEPGGTQAGPNQDLGGTQSEPSQGTQSEPSQGTQSEPSRNPVGTQSEPSREQRAVLDLLSAPMAPRDIRTALRRTDRTKFRDSVINPMLTAGWIERTVPDKPRSRLQQYRRTEAGSAIIETSE